MRMMRKFTYDGLINASQRYNEDDISIIRNSSTMVCLFMMKTIQEASALSVWDPMVLSFLIKTQAPLKDQAKKMRSSRRGAWKIVDAYIAEQALVSAKHLYY